MTEGALLQPGQLLLGRFEVRRLLGQGGMGAVYLAWHKALEMPVAIKVLSESLDDESPELSVRRFAREAKSLARVRSEFVCRPYDFGVLESGQPYLVMEFLDGPSLASYAEYNPISWSGAADIVAQASAGLAEAHRVGLVHRDVKPTNIILAPSQGRRVTTKLVDFGLSKFVGGDSLLTAGGRIVGTPEFMAPEQILAAHVDHRTDVWALGVLLFWLLTGQYPFHAPTKIRLLASIAEDAPADPRMFRPDLPADIVTLIMRCLEKDSLARLPTVAVFAQGLSRLVSPVGALAIEIATETLRVDATTLELPAQTAQALARVHEQNRSTALDDKPKPLATSNEHNNPASAARALEFATPRKR